VVSTCTCEEARRCRAPCGARRAERTFLESEGESQVEPQVELKGFGDSSFAGRSAWNDVCPELSGSVESEHIHARPPAAAHAFATESRPTPSLKADAQCTLNPGSKMRRHCGGGVQSCAIMRNQGQSGAIRRNQGQLECRSDPITDQSRTCVGVSCATPARF
jgi:hypothetical protein